MTFKAEMDHLFSVNELSGIILQVVLIASFVGVFFFTYASHVERQIVESQVDRIVEDFTKDLKYFLNRDQMAQIKDKISHTNFSVDKSQDKAVTDSNVKLEKKAFKSLSIVAGIGILLIGVLYGWSLYRGTPFNIVHTIKESLFILILVALTELAFLSFIAKDFWSADPNSIKETIASTLNTYPVPKK